MTGEVISRASLPFQVVEVAVMASWRAMVAFAPTWAVREAEVPFERW